MPNVDPCKDENAPEVSIPSRFHSSVLKASLPAEELRRERGRDAKYSQHHDEGYPVLGPGSAGPKPLEQFHELCQGREPGDLSHASRQHCEGDGCSREEYQSNSLRRCTSLGCSPMVGSSKTYMMSTRLLPRCRTILMRCDSPPERVVASRSRLR